MNTLTLKNVYYRHKIKDIVIKMVCTDLRMCITFIQNATEVHMNWFRLYHTFAFFITLLTNLLPFHLQFIPFCPWKTLHVLVQALCCHQDFTQNDDTGIAYRFMA